MKLVTFHEGFTVTYRKSTGACYFWLDPLRPYIFSATGLNMLFQGNGAAMQPNLYRLSSIEPRIPAFHVSARKVGHQRLLLYNGSSGYGDQLLTWPLGKLLHGMGFEVSILVDAGNQPCWQGFPWVRAIYTLPIPYSQFEMFDYHVMFQAVVNTDEHQDQKHPLDVMLNKIGIDPTGVPNNLKVVIPVFTGGELQKAIEPFPGQRLGLYQLCTSVATRSLTPEASVRVLEGLAKNFPELQWLGLYDTNNPKEYAIALEALRLPNAVPYCQPEGHLRGLWAMTATRAAVVVGPDSMMIHVAGSCGVPCVGLWGPTSPAKRVAYYSRHVPIHKASTCTRAPCFHYMADFPRYCPAMIAKQSMCDVLAAITPDEVVAATHKALSLQA
jgi:ADP-heptose:LPS heptosyltransferase